MLTLPADVLFLICEEVSKREDFNTLFKCALTSKSLAGPALQWLYRIHNRLIFNRETSDGEAQQIEPYEHGRAAFNHEISDGRLEKIETYEHGKLAIDNHEISDAEPKQIETYEHRKAVQDRNISMWALQWRSMIRSSLGRTFYPYCLYIRTLDLRALADLLEDPIFRETTFDEFFVDDMSQFLNAQETPMKQKIRGAKKRAYKRLDIPDVLNRVGESITKYISVSALENHSFTTVEELTGHIRADALLTWAERLSNLRTLTLWDGSVLNEKIGTAIATGCFYFDDLTFFLSSGPDHKLASFFGTLTPNSLRSFSALSASSVGPETLLSLNNHSKSLKNLKLDGLTSEGVKSMSLLQQCTALETLEIVDAEGLINLEATENDSFLEILEWLSRCKDLRELSFKNIINGPAILSNIFANNEVKLRELQLYGYSLHSNQEFHKALAHQTSLESLTLKGDPEGGWRDDIDTMVSSLTQLKNLKSLKLLTISDYFRSSEILLLAELTNLEVLEFSGYDVTDIIWPAIANLHKLRNISMQALTSFSCNSILKYISTLRETNRGLNLSVMCQRTEDPFTEQEQRTIQEAIAAKVAGKFDFILYREADSDDEQFSD